MLRPPTLFQRSLVLAVILACLSGAEGRSHAKGLPSGGPVGVFADSYCGLYCLYAAAKAVGRPVPFDDLLQPCYVGSPAGSSLDELDRAARACGLTSRKLANVTPDSLRAANEPLLLHVRRPGVSTPYDHWVLFLGHQEGIAFILDPPDGMRRVNFAELSAAWDGSALQVGTDDRNMRGLWLGGAASQAIALALAAVAVGFMSQIMSDRTGDKTRNLRRLWPCVSFVGVAVLLALTWHAMHPDGYIKNRVALAVAAGRFYVPDIPALSTEEVRALAGDSKVVFVDARSRRAYELGHLPAAVNVPVTSGTGERTAALAGIDKDQTLVVYCQSRECPWARSVAADIVLRGYRRVYVFADGWRGWGEK